MKIQRLIGYVLISKVAPSLMKENHYKGKISVLFILPSLGCGGAEMQVIDLLQKIDRKRFEVFLFSFSDELPLLNKLNGIALTHYNHPRRYKLDFSMVRGLSRIIRDNDIQVVHCTLQIGLLIGWLGGVFSQKRPVYINTLHRTLGRNLKEEILERIIYQWPMRNCKSVICVCKDQEEFWVKRFKFLNGRTRVIYNGVDTELYNPAIFEDAGAKLRLELNIPASASIVTCVAGFRVEKNHTGLLESFKQLELDKLDLYLLLAGDGQERTKIEMLVKTSHFQDRVRFLGNVNDVRPVLAASDLTVLASTAIETFSIAMLESMSMERPVITTNIGGQKEAICDKVNGRIVPVGCSDKLAQALNWCLSDHQRLKTMGTKARQRVIENFTVQEMVEKTENEIERAI